MKNKKNKFKNASDYLNSFNELKIKILKGLFDKNIFNTNLSDSFDCLGCFACETCVKCTNCVKSVDCQLCFDTDLSNNCFNSHKLQNCSFCYNSTDLKLCVRCNNCNYCFDSQNLSNCSNCIFCVGLKNKQSGYWVCNEEVSKEQFEFLMFDCGF